MTNLWPSYSAVLTGGWKCISFEQHLLPTSTAPIPDDKSTLVNKPHGDTPMGRVLISSHGYLSAHMARPDRVIPSGKSWPTAPDAEVAHVARGLAMYCGFLELFEDADGLWWRTKVDIASDPSRVGGWEVRREKLDEDEDGKTVLTLRPENEMILEDGRRVRGVLKWVKFE